MPWRGEEGGIVYPLLSSMACGHPGGVNSRTLLGAGLVLQASYAGVPEKPQDRQQEMGAREGAVRLHLGKASCCRNCWNNRGAKRMSGGHKGCTMQPPGNLSGLSRKLPPGEPDIQLVRSGTAIPATETLMNFHARRQVATAQTL